MRRLISLTVIFCALTAGSAPAGVIVYTNQTDFLAAVKPGYYLETFDSLPQGVVLPSPQSFSGNGFAYNASVTVDFFNVGPPGDTWFSTDFAGDPITFTFTGRPVTAVGGFFFPTDLAGDVTPGTITLTLSDGTTQVLTNPGATTFLGFVSNGAAISTLTVTPSGQDFTWATVNDLIVGQAIPEPTTVAVFGLLAAGAFGVRRRVRAVT
jgi:hypothetical protein